jgi:MerR family transcriptional regulator, mercuric resistance operon regulatory protein
MASPAFLSTGALARRAGLNHETVRYYEKVALLPAPRRAANGYRQYPPEAVARLRFIRRARELGFSLAAVRRLLRLAHQRSRSCAEAYDMAAAHLEDVRGKLADLRRLERLLREMVQDCERGTLPDCPLLEALVL